MNVPGLFSYEIKSRVLRRDSMRQADWGKGTINYSISERKIQSSPYVTVRLADVRSLCIR